ncbi:MAG: rRNA maturation RNase YbeY [Candidatus Azobacteroides pseudotrichonymphae]|jgi:rRNA maturation RNase YbeY|nr:MAG: rRNA maturation RNase YbeY [Candidatus Azobacteroides pseudotrichonymphae]
MAVLYTTLDSKFPSINRKITTRWIKQILIDYNKRAGDITCIFCSNDEILRINNFYLNHDCYTDIITFDYSKGDIISGDLFIALDMIKYNSIKYNVNYFEELYRVIIHGILHLCGFNDKLIKDIKVMREGENRALEKIRS